MRKLAVIAIGFVVAVAFAAPAGAKATKLPAAARAYVKAGAEHTPEAAGKMEDLSASGSNAWAYAIARGGLFQAAEDTGQRFPADTVTFSRTKAKVCGGTPETCLTLANFVVKKRKVVDYTRDGHSFEGALSVGDGSTSTALGSTFGLVGAYVGTEPPSLYVSVEVESGPASLSFSQPGTYVDPDGRRHESSAQLTPVSDLQPGDSTTMAFVFPDASPGGTLVVTSTDPVEGTNTETSIEVPTFSPS